MEILIALWLSLAGVAFPADTDGVKDSDQTITISEEEDSDKKNIVNVDLEGM